MEVVVNRNRQSVLARIIVVMAVVLWLTAVIAAVIQGNLEVAVVVGAIGLGVLFRHFVRVN